MRRKPGPKRTPAPSQLAPAPAHQLLWSYREFSAVSGLPLGTLYAKVFAGEVPHIRLGPRSVRFEPEVVLEWLRSRRVPVAQ